MSIETINILLFIFCAISYTCIGLILQAYVAKKPILKNKNARYACIAIGFSTSAAGLYISKIVS